MYTRKSVQYGRAGFEETNDIVHCYQEYCSALLHLIAG